MKKTVFNVVALLLIATAAVADPVLGGGGTPNEEAQPRGFGWGGGATENGGPAPGVAEQPKGSPDRAGNIAHNGFFGPVNNGDDD